MRSSRSLQARSAGAVRGLASLIAAGAGRVSPADARCAVPKGRAAFVAAPDAAAAPVARSVAPARDDGAAAAEAFGHIVEQGLENKRLGMKFLFRPGTAAMWSDPRSGPVAYPLWFNEIAKHAAARQSCLEVVGHASASGPEPVNERLSLLRAETVRSEIARQAPPLAQRMIANGMGSRQTMIGTGRDDLSDALDRRVEFKVVDC